MAEQLAAAKAEAVKWEKCVDESVRQNITLSNENKKLQEQLAAADKRMKQLEGDEPIPEAWWKECPKLAQKTMERVIDENNSLQQQLADYKEGCEGLKMSVGDLRDERDSLEQRLAAARAAVEKADTQWEPHNCRDVHPAYFKAALEILQKGGG